MEQHKEIKWKTVSDLPINDWKKLAKLFIKEKECFEKSKNIFDNRKLYRIIAFDTTVKDFIPYILIKAEVSGDFYHIGSYGMFGRISISKMYWSLEFLSSYKDIYLVKEENMETKEVKIEIPEGYEIDKEKSTFEKIVFKPIVKRWRDEDEYTKIQEGWFVEFCGKIQNVGECYKKCGVFATEKQAKSALAMAQISQIIANDERFGGVITDEEWKDNAMCKYTIARTMYGTIDTDCWMSCNYYFLTFHTREQRDLFLEENRDLVKDYLMID